MTPSPPQDDQRLQQHFDAMRVTPPDDLTERVMAALPEQPTSMPARKRSWWPEHHAWLAPALAGAAAAVVIMSAVWIRMPAPGAPMAQSGVTFVVHAPAAEQVELVGSFNQWRPGEIQLTGPDSTGRWTVTVPLPEGRHEYLYLVDGKQWVTDPGASFHRPDGFGSQNAIIDVDHEEPG